jgi:hypothetical protein
MFIGVIVSVAGLAVVLVKLSEVYRANCLARGRNDPGYNVLESVLVVSAGCTLVAFVIWFFLLAGASPVPLGMNF